MKKILPALCALFIATQHMPAADATSWWESWKADLRATWASDDYAVMIPFNTYHSRATYDAERIKGFNEMPWGLGLERHYTDELRNRHSLYVLAFAESYSHVQPTLGYTWEKSLFLNGSRTARIGVGFNAMITARQKNNYLPFPGATPTLSVNYRFLSVQTTWVPYLGRNDGNVFLTMLKISI